jgi:hypothetical protein
LLLEEVVLLVKSEEEATVARVVGLLKAAGVTEMVGVRDRVVKRENKVVGIHAAGAVETTAGTLLNSNGNSAWKTSLVCPIGFLSDGDLLNHDDSISIRFRIAY